MTAQESLLPCPFCGGEKIGWAVVDTVCVLGCDICNAYVEEAATTGSEARAKAEEAWNRRAAIPAQPVARTPLSESEVDDLWEGATGGHSFTEETLRTFVRAIEAAHGITQEKQG